MSLPRSYIPLGSLFSDTNDGDEYAQHAHALRTEGFFPTASEDPADAVTLDIESIEAGALDDWDMFCEGFDDLIY